MLKTFPGPGHLYSDDRGRLVMLLPGKLVYMAHHFILQRLNPLDLRVEGEGWRFEFSVSPDAGYLYSEDGVV